MTESWVSRWLWAFPFFAGSIALTVIIAAAMLARVLGGEADFTPQLVVLWVVLAAVILVAGLALDGVRFRNRPSSWEGTVRSRTLDFERATSIYFATSGWTAQRDEPDYKVFVRREGIDVGTVILLAILGIVPALIYLAFAARSGQSIVTFEIVPTMGGSRVRMEQSRGEQSADRFMRELDAMWVPESDAARPDRADEEWREKDDPVPGGYERDARLAGGDDRPAWDDDPDTGAADRELERPRVRAARRNDRA